MIMEDPAAKEAMTDGLKAGMASMGEDLLQDILSRLPAKSFAYAACVCWSWNGVCSRILSRPKLLSALSLNPRLEIALNEALNKVLSEPIRPHFAIVCVGRKFSLKTTHQIVMGQLGSGVPIITCEAPGVIGADAVTDEFREVKWVEGDHENSYSSPANVNRGVVLIIGFVPGLKVRTVPLIQFRVGPPQVPMIDKFVTDIKDFTASVSGCTSPLGIIMFADQYCDMKLVLEKLDYAMSKDTAIIGDDECGCFLYSNGDDSTIYGERQTISWGKNTKEQIFQSFRGDAVALVFAKERENRHGEIKFSVALSTGVSPVGPTYKGASVRVLGSNGPECSTWLNARREGSLEKLDGQRILEDIDHAQVENDISSDDLYIGVVRRRKCSIGSEKGKWISSLAFYEVLGADEMYLYVKGDGIKTGDQFQFYRPDPESALTSRNNVLEDFRALKQHECSKCGNDQSGTGNGDMEVCGGLIFSCFGRGESFFGRPNVDSSAITENFPGLPMGGMLCCGEIGRSSVTVRGTPINCCLHVYSTVYFLLSYKPKKRL